MVILTHTFTKSLYTDNVFVFAFTSIIFFFATVILNILNILPIVLQTIQFSFLFSIILFLISLVIQTMFDHKTDNSK